MIENIASAENKSENKKINVMFHSGLQKIGINNLND